MEEGLGEDEEGLGTGFEPLGRERKKNKKPASFSDNEVFLEEFLAIILRENKLRLNL